MVNSTFLYFNRSLGRLKPEYEYGPEDRKIQLFKVIIHLSFFFSKKIRLGTHVVILFFRYFFFLKMCPKLNVKNIIGCRSAKDVLAIYRSINLGFDAEVA